MAPLFWSTKKGHSPSTSVDTEQKHQDQDYPGVASVEHPDYGHGDALHVECPSHTTEGRLVMRVDRRLIPLLCILYLLAFLDRVNIANANVAGLSRDLKLAGDEYNTALVIFFVPYVLFEIPGNMLLKKLGPRVWLSLNMLLFGFTTVMQVSTSSMQVKHSYSSHRRVSCKITVDYSRRVSSSVSSNQRCSQVRAARSFSSTSLQIYIDEGGLYPPACLMKSTVGNITFRSMH